MAKDFFFIPLGGSGGGGGFDPTQYYTRDQVDALIQDFITRSVNDLVNYYTKSETYTQAEVNTLIGGIESIHFEFAASTSDVQDPQSNVIYLIGPSGTGADQYEEYVYANNQWKKIGDTSIDLSGYATTTDLQNAINTAMATLQQYTVDNFYQKSEVDAMIAQVQTLQGIQGIAGQNGTNGEQGIQGIKGTDGTNGEQGIQGIAGQNGTNGVDGSQGIQGVAGQNGSNGEQGIQGIKGADGVNGLQGIQGPAGGGGDNAWYGTQAEFDALQSVDTNTDYFISDPITWDEIADKPNVPTKISELPNDEGYVTDKEMKNYINERKIMHIVNSHNWYGTQAEYEALQTLNPDTNYHIEGDEVSLQMTFTFTDSTQAVYDVFVRPTV